MAFAFLKGLSDIANIAGTLGTIFGPRRNIAKEIPTLQPSIDAAEAARVYAAAAANPNDPRFQNLAALFEEKTRRDTISAIRDIIRLNNRAMARGLPGIGINPERRDEAISSAIATQNELAKEQARLSARDYLLAASQGQANAAQGFASTFQPFQAFGDIAAGERSDRLKALGQLGSKLPDLADIFRNVFGGSRPIGGEVPARGRLLNGSVSSTVNPGTNYFNRYNPGRLF